MESCSSNKVGLTISAKENSSEVGRMGSVRGQVTQKLKKKQSAIIETPGTQCRCSDFLL